MGTGFEFRFPMAYIIMYYVMMNSIKEEKDLFYSQLQATVDKAWHADPYGGSECQGRQE
uniref:Uncharacterized protein n=1 Tax=Arion vulgaris TaxID=1028688 RepID=A0A0B7BU56_9EUPU